MSGVHGLSNSEVVVGGVACQGWWLVLEEEDGSGRIVAGPFPDRVEADWAAGASEHPGPLGVRPVHGTRRADGGLDRRPSPQDWAWLAHLEEQLDRLPAEWDSVLSDDDPLTSLVVEVAAALSEAGLHLYESTGAGYAVGGVCLTPTLGLGGIVVTWCQHDRMSIDQVHGADAGTAIQHVMNRALADVLVLRGFVVDPFGDSSGHIVRAVA